MPTVKPYTHLIPPGCELVESIRIKDNGAMKLGKVTLSNKTGNSIAVVYDEEKDLLEINACCLEEQGK